MTRRPITQNERTDWSVVAQVELLQSFCEVVFWKAPEYAFQGGTSLSIIWGSPRYSEDLDFLVSEAASETLPRDMPRVIDLFTQRMLSHDAAFKVQFSDKSNDPARMRVFHIKLDRPKIIGNVMVKMEFWRVTPAYLQGYQTQVKQAVAPRVGDYRLKIDCSLPVSTLQSIFADKLGAIGSRPYLKMRDFFDIWWIRKQPEFVRPGDQEMLERYRHHLTAYRQETPPVHALNAFLEKTSDIDALVKKCEVDLQSFLPAHVWRMFYPEQVREMVLATREEAQAMVNLLDKDMQASLEITSSEITSLEIRDKKASEKANETSANTTTIRAAGPKG